MSCTLGAITDHARVLSRCPQRCESAVRLGIETYYAASILNLGSTNYRASSSTGMSPKPLRYTLTTHHHHYHTLHFAHHLLKPRNPQSMPSSTLIFFMPGQIRILERPPGKLPYKEGLTPHAPLCSLFISNRRIFNSLTAGYNFSSRSLPLFLI